MLFYTGNEASVELYVNATGLMWERAPELGARLVFAEHRYYGKSLPLGEASTANSSTLRWLTMEQALVDFSRLIYALQTDGKTSAVIAIGGSYGGMLAAWLRMHFTVGAMAHTLQNAHMLAEISGGDCRVDDDDAVLEQLVAYAVGGFGARIGDAVEEPRP